MNIILTKAGGFWIAHTEQGEPLGCARDLRELIAPLLIAPGMAASDLDDATSKIEKAFQGRKAGAR